MNIDWQNVIVSLIVMSAVLYALRGVLRMFRMMRRRPGSSLCGTCGSCSQNSGKENRVNVVSIDLPGTESILGDAPGGECGQRRDESVVADIPPASPSDRPSHS